MRRRWKDAIEVKERSFLELYEGSAFIARNIAPKQACLINRRKLNSFKVKCYQTTYINQYLEFVR